MLRDPKPPAVVIDHVPSLGDPSELIHQEPGDGFVFAFGEVDVEERFGLVDPQASQHQEAASVEALDPHLANVVFVADLTHELLDEVFDRDDPGRAAVFVDH